MAIGDESLGIPQGAPGMPQQMGGNPIASLLQQLSQRQQQAPKNGTEVAPLLQMMSPTQSSGPMAQPRAHRPEPMQNQTKQDKVMGAISAGMQGLGAGVREAKQKKFEQEASMAAIFTAASIAEEKQKAGMPLTPQELQSIKMASNDKLSKKKEKIMEKAMTDPMSGAYVGTQRAHQAINEAAVKAQEQQQKIEDMRAQALQRAMYAEYLAGRNPTSLGVAGINANAKTENEQNKLVQQGALKGMNVSFVDGKIQETPFTQEQISANPMLKAQQAKEAAYTDAAIARVRQGDVRLQIDKERLNLQKKLLDLRALHESKLPNQANAPKFNSLEQNRMDMAQIAQDYLTEMREIVDRRKVDSPAGPALFGTGAWGRNKMAVAMADQDPDAARWAVLTDLTKQPMVGMHFRNAQAMKDMDDMNSSFYRSPESVSARIDEELKGTQRIKETAGRPTKDDPTKGTSGAPTGSSGGNSNSKKLDQATATQILQQAGGDKEKARKIAKAKGYDF